MARRVNILKIDREPEFLSIDFMMANNARVRHDKMVAELEEISEEYGVRVGLPLFMIRDGGIRYDWRKETVLESGLLPKLNHNDLADVLDKYLQYDQNQEPTILELSGNLFLDRAYQVLESNGYEVNIISEQR